MTSAIDTMSARRIDKAEFADNTLPPLLVSADSHVDEPFDLWDDLPRHILEKMGPRRPLENRPPGGMDPKLRVPDMDLDGVAAEIIYPSACMKYYELDQEVQEAVFPVYNDWVADYCKIAPKRLFAVPALPTFDIKFAMKELRRCHDMGLVGCMVWRVPPKEFSFTDTKHYEPLWAMAAEMGAPVNLHTLTGENWRKLNLKGVEFARGASNFSIQEGMNTLFDLIWTGVCDRHPKIRFELVESELGWLPFLIQQWDYYFKRFSRPGQTYTEFPIKRLPSEIFTEHVYATFMDDFVGTQALKYWGERNCMWSSDYPHPNMTWPNSRAFIAKNIGDLPMEKKKRLLSQNVIELYGLEL
jgi:predicted TIM-barrel fold metal-dependent hydrolase